MDPHKVDWFRNGRYRGSTIAVPRKRCRQAAFSFQGLGRQVVVVGVEYRGPLRQVVVAGVKIKVAFHDIREGTFIVELL